MPVGRMMNSVRDNFCPWEWNLRKLIAKIAKQLLGALLQLPELTERSSKVVREL
jgi:hypothetical protein